ncbi:Protein of unknown function [Planifilum fulgidum]|jgi:hypothetical protein|uniref:Uncharacterized protein n=1 Tax=Planifilum fulgidum TaxID=201973 RepID=A0A1I2KZ56_9BACL|nr:DUF2553 family protein [Planifilum fulgidum]MBO2495500.1 DUF2553 domain-containing protein [Bacillota bacterium]MBO2531632.1 DUF2553 domain-containing protein [Thermoactinomycetaceae bacterium]SFF71628.1 Protein of unknown function [Planifilum fulgidum]
MDGNTYRINITRKVVGRFRDGDIVLYYHKQPIGRIALSEGGGIEMAEGYEMDNHHIYVLGRYDDHKDQYTQSCDMGWC